VRLAHYVGVEDSWNGSPGAVWLFFGSMVIGGGELYCFGTISSPSDSRRLAYLNKLFLPLFILKRPARSWT
jgi:hypothetical protein